MTRGPRLTGAEGGRVLSTRRQRQRAILAAMAAVGIVLGALSYNAHVLDTSLQAATYDTFITYAPGKLSNQVTHCFR